MSEFKKIYDPERFNALLHETVNSIQKLSKLKGGEYAGDKDRLANFRNNAERLGLLMEQVWGVYAGKHWDALQQYIKDLGTNTKRERLEGLEGRCDDLIVYLCLFKAMLEESNGPPKPFLYPLPMVKILTAEEQQTA